MTYRKLPVKFQNYKDKKIVVMSPPQDPDNNCPSMVVSQEKVSLKDDYNKKVLVSKSLLKRLSSL